MLKIPPPDSRLDGMVEIERLSADLSEAGRPCIGREERKAGGSPEGAETVLSSRHERGNVLRAVPLDEFLRLDIKPRTQLLAPVLPEKGLAMLYAPRGMGKTYLGLYMAYAIAAGGTLMRWKAPSPRKVLYIDGEMPIATLKDRLINIAAGMSEKPKSADFMTLPADYFASGLPNLATRPGQEAVEPLLDGVDLIVIDNISTLASAGPDNEAASWTPMQEWLLRLRRRGCSVLLIHHAGKGGQQRGTSRREDVLDTIIALRRPSDYTPSEGARFNVEIEKARGIYGEDVKPFEARLDLVNGAAQWTHRDLADADTATIGTCFTIIPCYC
jgi:putative DNA primase/helicase